MNDELIDIAGNKRTENVLLNKSKAFAIRVVGLYKYLTQRSDLQNREFVLSKQTLRSGTSVGANIREAQRAQTTADFLSKLFIAFKEADETAYWLELLHETDYITDEMFNSLYSDCEEILKLLSSITKSTRQNQQYQ